MGCWAGGIISGPSGPPVLPLPTSLREVKPPPTLGVVGSVRSITPACGRRRKSERVQLICAPFLGAGMCGFILGVRVVQ